MNLSNLQKDIVYIQKQDGARTGPFKTTVTSDSATIFDDKLDVTEGEILIRPLPTGKEESYLITSANFSRGLSSIPAHFTLKLQKTTAIQNAMPQAKHTTVNIHNSTGVQVGDHNVINIQNALTELIERIESSNAPPKEKVEAKGAISALLAHPLVGSILGGVAGSLAGLL